MLISFVVPFKNPCSGGRRVEWFRQCIESVLSQKGHANIELILVDDGSEDISTEVALEYCSTDKRVQLHITPGGGVVNARNTGMRFSHGDFIAECASDDWLDEEYCTEKLAMFRRNSSLGIIGSHTCQVDANGAMSKILRRPEEHLQLVQYALDKCPFTHPMYRRNLLVDVGYYEEGYFGAEDYEYWIRVLSKIQSATIPKVLVYCRKHNNRTSTEFRDAQVASAEKIKIKARDLFNVKKT